jgi:hypothetical protein
VDLLQRLNSVKKSTFFSATNLGQMILERDNFLWFEIIKVRDTAFLILSIIFLPSKFS